VDEYYDENLLVQKLIKAGHEVCVRHDDYIYWCTSVVHIDDFRFVMMHEYGDEDVNRFIVEGFIENGIIKLERMVMMHQNQRGDRKIITTMEQLISNGEIYNHIPFQYVMEHYSVSHPKPVTFDFKYDSGKTWTNPDLIWQWFSRACLNRRRK
jgi:hypothetical protein